MKHRIQTDSTLHEFRVLRNRIEAEVQAPAVILVTSATDRDGAHVTALGVAESLSKTHQRTALVLTFAPGEASSSVMAPYEAGPPRRRASDRLGPGASRFPESGLSKITISRERLTTISRTNVASLVTELRAEHSYIVIDGGGLPTNSIALLLAASADAVLVTFLTGRQQSPSDRVMLDILERAEAKILGVVMTDDETIRHFDEPAVEAETESPNFVIPKRASNPLAQRLEVALQRLGKH